MGQPQSAHSIIRHEPCKADAERQIQLFVSIIDGSNFCCGLNLYALRFNSNRPCQNKRPDQSLCKDAALQHPLSRKKWAYTQLFAYWAAPLRFFSTFSPLALQPNSIVHIPPIYFFIN